MSDDFEVFYATRKDTVLRAMLAATGDHARAEDAAAEAFTRAYSHWARVSRHANPTAWVLRVAINSHRSWWRRLRRELLGALPERAAPASPAGLEGHLRALIAELPGRQRAVVALRVLADLSPQETAELLGIAPATVHVHLHRALVTLRVRLGVGDPAGDKATAGAGDEDGKAEEVRA